MILLSLIICFLLAVRTQSNQDLDSNPDNALRTIEVGSREREINVYSSYIMKDLDIWGGVSVTGKLNIFEVEGGVIGKFGLNNPEIENKS